MDEGTISVNTARGPHVLWSLVFQGLLHMLIDHGAKSVGYADDI